MNLGTFSGVYSEPKGANDYENTFSNSRANAYQVFFSNKSNE